MFWIVLGTLILVYIVAAAALNIAFGYGHFFNMTIGATLSLGAYTTIILAVDHGWHFLAAGAMALVVGAIFGVLIAIPALRAQGDAFAVVSVALALGLEEVLKAARSITGGFDGIGGLRKPSYPGSSLVTTDLRYLVLAAIIGGMILIVLVQLARSRFGLLSWASGYDRSAVASFGWPVWMSTVGISVAVSAAGAGAGVIYAGLVGFIGPVDFNLSKTFLIFAMVVFGGTRNLFGSSIGAIVIIGLPEVIRYNHIEISNFASWTNIAVGTVVFVVIALRPGGLISARKNAWIRRSKEIPDVAGEDLLTTHRDSLDGSDKSVQAIRLSDISVSFGSVQALSGINLDLPNGVQTVGVIGPNGAGKTTLLNVIAGQVAPTGGVVFMNLSESAPLSPHNRARRGLLRTFQDLRVFDEMTCIQNVLVAQCARTRGLKLFQAPSTDDVRRSSDALVAVGLGERLRSSMKDLSYGERRLVAVARVLVCSPSLVLLDEPAAGAGHEQIAQLEQVLNLFRTAQIPTVIVDHKVEMIWDVSDRVIVLDGGRIIADGTPDQVRSDPRVRSAYLGRSAELLDKNENQRTT